MYSSQPALRAKQVIHCFTIASKNLVLDIESGSLHQVDDAMLTVLNDINKQIESSGASAVTTEAFLCASFEMQSEISTLINAGLLFSMKKGTENSTKDSNSINEYMKNRRPVVKALCLHMAHECNLRCAYCFAGDGTYFHELVTDRGLMPLDVGKKALDFLILHSGTRHNLEVDFFGGEPMLNFNVVKKLLEYGRSREAETGKKFRFTLTTNGSLLTDEANQYINQHFDNVVLSLDGRQCTNDRMRKMHNGSGSYSQVLPKIKAFADSRNHKNYYVRGTFTRHNPDFAADVLHLAECGFKHISVEPVVAPQEAEYSLRKEDLPELFLEYEKLAVALVEREYTGQRVHFFHFEMDLSGGPCLAKRITGCGAGSEYLAVTPSGKLYPCHQFVGDEKFQIGDLTTGVTKTGLIEEFSACNVFSKPECMGCWARYYCSGGCMATAYHTHGDILKPEWVSCELQRKRVECALYVFSERAEKE